MKTILVIDDDEVIRFSLKRVLEGDGHRVILADGGEGGLGIARTELPDLILLDIMMPGMDGFEVLRELKEQSATSLIPVIVVTGTNDGRSIKQAFYEYDADYVIKPVDADTLRRMVAKKLSGENDDSEDPASE